MAYDPTHGVLLVVNNADTPPFATFVIVNQSTGQLTVSARITFDAAHGVDAQNGAEQPVWDGALNRFFLSIPQIGPNVVHVLQDEQPRHQPGRQRRLPHTRCAYPSKPAVKELPIHLPRQPQRMAEVDDVLQRRPQQILLTIVSRLRHRVPHADDPPPNRTDRRKRESQIARNPGPNLPFLANTITSAQSLGRPAQRLGGSSRATSEG